jgi:hypothetical protein
MPASLTDRFYEKHDLTIVFRIRTDSAIDPTNVRAEITDDGEGWHTVRFSHRRADGMSLLLAFSDLPDNDDAGTGCCAVGDIDLFWLGFFSHIRTLLHPPSAPRPRDDAALVCENVALRKSDLDGLGVRRGSALCALQVCAFFRRHPGSAFCKTQIVCYLPGITGTNKTFPDVLLVPRGDLKTVARWIDLHRRRPHAVEGIYQKYRFFSRFVWIDRTPSFDATFSNLGTVPSVDGLEILSKSAQHERSYMNAVANTTGGLFLSLVHDRDIAGFSETLVECLFSR